MANIQHNLQHVLQYCARRQLWLGHYEQNVSDHPQRFLPVSKKFPNQQDVLIRLIQSLQQQHLWQVPRYNQEQSCLTAAAWLAPYGHVYHFEYFLYATGLG